jgi:hypothetical protein
MLRPTVAPRYRQSGHGERDRAPQPPASGRHPQSHPSVVNAPDIATRHCRALVIHTRAVAGRRCLEDPSHGARGRCGKFVIARGWRSSAAHQSSPAPRPPLGKLRQRCIMPPLRQCAPPDSPTAAHRTLHDIVATDLPPSIWLLHSRLVCRWMVSQLRAASPKQSPRQTATSSQPPACHAVSNFPHGAEHQPRAPHERPAQPVAAKVSLPPVRLHCHSPAAPTATTDAPRHHPARHQQRLPMPRPPPDQPDYTPWHPRAVRRSNSCAKLFTFLA